MDADPTAALRSAAEAYDAWRRQQWTRDERMILRDVPDGSIDDVVVHLLGKAASLRLRAKGMELDRAERWLKSAHRYRAVAAKLQRIGELPPGGKR